MVGVPWAVQSIRGALRRGTKPRWRGVRQGILEEVTFRLRIGRISQVKGGEWPEGLQLREEPVPKAQGDGGHEVRAPAETEVRPSLFSRKHCGEVERAWL